MLEDFMKTRSRGLRDFSSDDILSALGLSRRQSAFDAAIPVGLAFVAGLAAGAGAALLLAPKSGRETRQDIANKASELSAGISTKASELSSKASELTAGISNKASELTGRATSAVNEIASEVRAALPHDATRSVGGTNRTS